MRVCCWTRLDKPPAPSPEAGGTGRSLGLTQPGSTSPGWAAGLLGRAGLGLRLLAPRGSVNCARKGGPASASPASSPPRTIWGALSRRAGGQWQPPPPRGPPGDGVRTSGDRASQGTSSLALPEGPVRHDKRMHVRPFLWPPLF